MAKTNASAAKATKPAPAPVEALAERSSDVFDDRRRTVPRMARTVHRLCDAKAQKILDREALPIAYWYYLRVLVERGEVNQLELSKRVGIASTTAVPRSTIWKNTVSCKECAIRMTGESISSS